MKLKGKRKQHPKQQIGYFGMHVMWACSANYGMPLLKTIFLQNICFKGRKNIQMKSISKANSYQMHAMHLYKIYMYKFTIIYLHLQ